MNTQERRRLHREWHDREFPLQPVPRETAPRLISLEPEYPPPPKMPPTHNPELGAYLRAERIAEALPPWRQEVLIRYLLHLKHNREGWDDRLY